MSGIIERLGLDWLPLLIGRQPFEDALPPFPSTFGEIRKSLGDLEGEKLDDALANCSDLLNREDDRSNKIESKAFTLIGITGIATGFITGFATLLLDRGKITSVAILTVAAFLYVLVVLSLMLTIYLAVKVVTITDYRFTYPSANDILNRSMACLSYIKRERTIALFYSFVKNIREINRKATYLGGAQLWFRNSIVLLLVLTLLLAIYAPIGSLTQANKMQVPIGGLIPTIQPTTRATDTPMPTLNTTVSASTPTIMLVTGTVPSPLTVTPKP